ncbi:single-stranded DNA-binding protein [Chryseobacterium taklimakanense]|uniref:single-stranded DNA-binding protein n=1 Tax=Chryseobacterium taklimakanense TaxID=536441 RepID=UPI001EF69FCD|nr:single-stranded DNA-binding protein [Chryseobacterium taklimakanense]MCG7281516.1 single-stranded DNA-binding protein [Chryseobacterium taklimakanense]
MNTIVGRITKNAQINTLKDQRHVVNFSVAINDYYKAKAGERKEQNTFYNCSYWISPNVAKILTKGTLVELTGRISPSAWIGRDGEIKSGLNFHTSRIKLHGGGKQNYRNAEAPFEQIQHASAQTENINPFSDDTEDDLPF